ncbi:MAG TPA: ABC transporter ATP-binding protein [Polyangiaceae bacterium]|nr:ABC transporter ATP-binding protein [Polyangiaceae bacterium]
MRLSGCEGVTHEFDDAGSPVVALANVSLDVAGGELVLLVGPSGSGKSTLLSVLGGLMKPTRGAAWLCDTPLTELDAEGRARARREHLGFVFQSFHLFGALSARGNVECVLEMKGASRRDQVGMAERALRQVGLGARLDHLPAQLSGGERQRVALARALATAPRVIFGDEPTSSIDAKSASLVLEVLQGFVDASRCVVLATHDPRLYPIATRIVTLENGAIVDDRAPSR